MSNPALWTAIAGVITAIAGLIVALKHTHPPDRKP